MIDFNSKLVAGTIEVRSSKNKSDEFVTLAGSFPYNQTIDLGRTSEVVQSGAFRQSTIHQHNGLRDIRLLYEHDPRKPLASTVNRSLTLKDTKTELRFKAQVYALTSWASDILGGIRSGLVTGISPGFIVKHAASDANGLRRIVDANLIELSIVSQPAYPDARVAEREMRQDLRRRRWGVWIPR